MPDKNKRPVSVNLLLPFLIVVLVFGLLIWQKYRTSREVPSKPQVQQASGKRTVVLFFVAEGTRLAREARDMEACTDTTACVKGVLEELFNGPVADLDESVPESAVVQGVSLAGDTVIVDLNKAFVDDLAPGSSAEMLAVYAIVDTVCVNFPQITKVRLTIDGQPGTQLRHLDLSDPLAPDYGLEKVPPPPADRGAADTSHKPGKGKQ